MLRSVAAAVGAEGDIETTALQAITVRLAERGPTLIILDNVEHLLPHAAAEIAGLLESIPQLRIVATSQVPLRIGAECVLALDALDDEAALAIIERVTSRRARPLPLAAADREALLDVVHLLDGLPLALELAAARLALLKPPQLRDRLRSSLDLLREDRSDRPQRQRSLGVHRRVDAWPARPARAASCSCASPCLPVRWRSRCSSRSSAATASRCSTRLPTLLDVGLVRRVETGDGRVRFGLPEALRQIAAAKLARSPEGVRWRRTHAHHVADLVWPARVFYVTRPVYDAAWEAGPEAAAAAPMGIETPAIPWLAGSPSAMRQCSSTTAGYARRWRRSTCWRPIPRRSRDSGVCRHRSDLCARHLQSSGRGGGAAPARAGARSRRSSTGGGDDAGATMHLFGGDIERGLAEHLQATGVARRVDDVTLAGALMLEAQARLIAGQLDAVEPTLAEAERIGLPAQAAYLDRRMTIYGDLAMARGQTRHALERYVQSLAYAQRAGNELQVLFDLLGVARALAEAGEDEATVEVSAMADAHAAELGGPGETIIGHLLGEGAVNASRLRLGPGREAAAARGERCRSRNGSSGPRHWHLLPRSLRPGDAQTSLRSPAAPRVQVSKLGQNASRGRRPRARTAGRSRP